MRLPLWVFVSSSAFFALASIAACSSDDSGGAPQDGGAPDVTTVGDGGVDAAADVHTDAPIDAAVDAMSYVQYVGRFDTTDPAGPRFEWSGSALHARFVGTSLHAQIGGTTNHYEIVIDGKVTARIATDPNTLDYEVASGLTPGQHDIVIYRRTEALFGPGQFLGLDPASSLIAAGGPSARHIEIIGDSISCGYGDEGGDASCHFTIDTENEYLSYGAIAARALGAEQRTIAWSGRGVYRNYGGDTVDPLPVLFDRTLPTEDASVWSFAAPLPDVVVINLGTNDFGQGDPGAPFVPAYEAFLAHVRAKYPQATIFCALGPLIIDPALSTARGYIQKVVADANADGGGGKVYFLEFATQDLQNDGAGCDYHPNLITHQKMADVLVKAIKEKLGW